MKQIYSTEGTYYEGWVFFHHKTEKATLVSKDGEKGNAVWIPNSQIINEAIPVSNEDDILEIEICIPGWLAKDKELR